MLLKNSPTIFGLEWCRTSSSGNSFHAWRALDRLLQPICIEGAFAGRSFASFRRFWAVAASVNSSFTPNGPPQPQSAEPQDTFQMREEHLDLLAPSRGRLVAG
ncbi:hypothetical protein JHX88_03080 [Paracoccus saliphilus]|uniref:Uncharacterized protein n=1 Tax=Paracoccus saliphilus TaxID=405559 RepID=A0ABY7S9P8_9RHOB|nr:hypothetical protein JHX88_03080 [Paracoccus saliphilus]